MDGNPLRDEQLYPIPGPWTGHLSIVPRPRGGDWLDAEVRAWKEAGIDAVVSLLASAEERELGLQAEAEISQSAGVCFFAFPIPDRQTPGSAEKLRHLTAQLSVLLASGQSVAVHCRQGVGRSSLLAAALLVEAGVSPDEAFDRIERARGCPVPDTPEQRRWVERFPRSQRSRVGTVLGRSASGWLVDNDRFRPPPAPDIPVPTSQPGPPLPVLPHPPISVQ